MKFRLVAAAATACIAAFSPMANASEYDDQLKSLVEAELLGWLNDPELISALKAQNEEHAGLTQSDIDGMDQTWRAEVGSSSTTMIDGVLSRTASVHLAEKQEASQGLVTEVFVMDNRGLNVAQSAVTSDYWQGDEDKFQQSFGNGAGAIHIGEVELDESSQTYQSQVSVAIADPDSNEVIGAATFGINLEMLE
ncbi:hypothetical protein [Amaricoccus tamworthensis]|uniref:hypothetical protein n=1 Tax=Amaricoccus tamworthensis TaxID=57002 RepID=UPI003C7DD97F